MKQQNTAAGDGRRQMCLPGWRGKHTPVNGRIDRFHFQDQLQRMGSGSLDSCPKSTLSPSLGPRKGAQMDWYRQPGAAQAGPGPS